MLMSWWRERERTSTQGRQVRTKWLKIVFRLMYPDYCLLAHCQKSSGWLSAIGAQPLIQPGPRHSWLCSFFSSQPSQPGITLREQLTVRIQRIFNPLSGGSLAPRWRVTVRCEFNGLHYCQAQTIIRTEMEMMVFFLLKASQSEDLTMQSMEELRVVKYKL